MVTLRRNCRLWAKYFRYAWGYVKAPILWWYRTGQWPNRILMIGRAPIFDVWGTLSTETDLRLRGVQLRSQFSTGANGTIKFGKNVFINQGAVFHAEQLIRVGNRVSIGDRAVIYDTNFHPVVPGGRTKIAPVEIEDDVWIASGVTILPGVTIGRGAVIGAGCIVTSDVPPGSVLKPSSPAVAFRFDVSDDMRRL